MKRFLLVIFMMMFCVGYAANITFVDGEGIDSSTAGTNFTVAGEDASTSNKGVASFNSNHFSTTTGAVSVVADGVDDTLVDWGSGANQIDMADIPGGVASANAFDFGASTSLEIPNGATNTVDADGEMAIDTTDDQIVYYGDTDERVITFKHSDSIVIPSPTDSAVFLWFKPQDAITITNVYGIVDPEGTAESVSFDIQECDATGDNCVTIDAAIVAGNDGALDDGSLTNPTIDSADWVGIDIGTVTGTVSNLTIDMYYTIDRE